MIDFNQPAKELGSKICKLALLKWIFEIFVYFLESKKSKYAQIHCAKYLKEHCMFCR